MKEKYTKMTRKDEGGLEQTILVNTEISVHAPFSSVYRTEVLPFTAEETLRNVQNWARDLESELGNFIENMGKLGYQTFSYGDVLNVREGNYFHKEIWFNNHLSVDFYFGALDILHDKNGLTFIEHLIGENIGSISHFYESEENGIHIPRINLRDYEYRVEYSGLPDIILPNDSQIQNLAHALRRMKGFQDLIHDEDISTSYLRPDIYFSKRSPKSYDEIILETIKKREWPHHNSEYRAETLVRDVLNFSDYLHELRSGFKYLGDYLDGIRENDQ